MVHEQTSRQFKINNNAAYSLMVHSHVLCNETLFEDVYRLTPGTIFNILMVLSKRSVIMPLIILLLVFQKKRL